MSSMKDGLLWFQAYYVTQVCINVVFIAYYVYLAFKQRQSCINSSAAKPDGTPTGEDLKSTFTTAFVIGFILFVINFTVCTFIEPVVRLVAFERDRLEENAPKYSTLFLIGFSLDIIFRCGFIVFSVWQISLVSSVGVAGCMKEFETLAHDANWMKNLAIA